MLKDLSSDTFFEIFVDIFLYEDTSLKVINKTPLVTLVCCKNLSCQCQVVFKLEYLIICCSLDTFFTCLYT